MKYIKAYLDKLSILQKIEYIVLFLLAFTIPIGWQVATKIVVLLIVVMVIRCVAEKGRGLSLNRHSNKKLYLFFATTYIMYAISMLYTSNVSDGWQNMEKKLSFIIFPLFFFVSDMTYLSSKRIKALFYAFLSGLLLFIVSNMLWAIYDFIVLDAPIRRFLGWEITKINYIHHTYIAMYACFGIIYSFVELFDNHLKSKGKIAFLLSTLVLSTLFVILVESRAGILCMFLLFACLFAWLFFVKKKRMITMCVGTALAVLLVIFFLLFPSGLNRIIKTQQDLVDTEHKEDIRITLLKAGLSVAKENCMFGVGVGDRCDVLIKYYEDNNLECGDLNSHNQFVDTTISIGMLGLLLLLGYFVVPIVLFAINKRWDVVMLLFLFSIAFNAVFEAVFETQTGILYFNFIFCLLFYDRFVAGNNTLAISENNQ
ncbi:MAG: O-antigen ligase family protein [Bacteroidales bacterium]|nr:O-antigen ligase family protein [Bacteroidales bacterium]